MKIDVGYDDGSEKIYTLLVILDVAPGWLWELNFCIVEYDGETGATRDIWDGAETVGIFLKDDRALIRSHVRTSIMALINTVQPDRVSLSTISGSLPAKAETKYDEIAYAVGTCGYRVQRSDSYHGQRIWWMERTAPSTV